MYDLPNAVLETRLFIRNEMEMRYPYLLTLNFCNDFFFSFPDQAIKHHNQPPYGNTNEAL